MRQVMRAFTGKTKASRKPNALGSFKDWADSARKFLSHRQPAWSANLREPKGQRWAVIIGASFIAAFIIAPQSFQFYSLTVGQPAGETVISPITFKVIDQAATDKIRDEVLKSVLPIYDFDDDMVHEVQQRIITAFSFVRDYMFAEAEFNAGGPDKAEPARSADDRSAGRTPFRPIDESTLRTRFENLLGASVPPSSFSVIKSHGFNTRIERDLRSLIVPLLLRGVVLSRELVMRDGKQGILLLPKSSKRLEPVKDLSVILDLHEAFDLIDAEDRDFVRDRSLSLAIRQTAKDLVYVNMAYNREKSDSLKTEALASVKPVFFQVSKGEPIIKEGEPANEGHLRKLAGLNSANPAYSRYMILVGIALTLALLLRLSFYFSEKYLDRSKNATEDLLLFSLLLLGTIIVVRFMFSLSPLVGKAGQGMSPRSILFAAPVATGAMLAALMVDARIAFIFAVLTSLAAAMAVEGDIHLFVFYFISGIVGLHGMTRITDRTSVLRAGLVVGLVNMVSILAIKMALGELSRIQDFHEIGLGFLGGVLSGLLVSGFAPLLEPLGYTTNIRLLEIASLNHPLLKEMSLEAPGTYHHSIMVGNLAEAAAESIGANPLLARVGGLYHDIGKAGKKMKPSYFIENQDPGVNPHDKLEPSMSALILVSHVKNGVDKAKEYRLATPIIDIIQQHHGTNLIRFFYNKALERVGKDHQAVSEDKYHYSGPRPQSKEAALVMLADVTEAACRTLTDPTPAQIQKRVETLVMGMFNEGQLDQSTLTLKDIHAMTKSFVRALQAILHGRIDYPEDARPQEKSNGDLNRQQADSHRSRLGRTWEEGGKNIRTIGL